MKNYRVFVFFFITISLMFTASGQPLPPGHSTECMSNPGSPACQNPVYTDNLSEYLYDLRTSWTFNNQAPPDDSGPTVFEGGSAGNLSQQSNDAVTSPDKTEYFIQNPGEAETYSFGRGNLQNTDIQVTGSEKGWNTLGEYLINPPHQGQCGDGIEDPGEDSTNCPEDMGTPDVEISGFTPNQDIEYDSTGSINRDIPVVAPSIDTHVDGYVNGEPDTTNDGSYIYEETVSQNLANIGSVQHHYIKDTATTEHFSETADTEVEYYAGPGSNNPKSYCSITEEDTTKYLNDTLSFDRKTTTVSSSGPEMKYDAPGPPTSGQASATVTYSEGWSADRPNNCKLEKTLDVSCDQSEQFNIEYQEGGYLDAEVNGRPSQITYYHDGGSTSGPDYREVGNDLYKEKLSQNPNALITSATQEYYSTRPDKLDREIIGATSAYGPISEIPEDEMLHFEGNTVLEPPNDQHKIDVCEDVKIIGVKPDNPVTEKTKDGVIDVKTYSTGSRFDSTLGYEIKYETVKDPTIARVCDNWNVYYSECRSIGAEGSCNKFNKAPLKHYGVGDEWKYWKHDRSEQEDPNPSDYVTPAEKKSKEVFLRYSDYSVTQESNPYCEQKESDVHGNETRDTVNVDQAQFSFTYDDYNIVSTPVWGPVNSKPGMFDDVDVHNTAFGYHSDTTDKKINSQGSNDPSVSANHYEIKNQGSSFIAENILHRVADADGPNGEGDGLIAFNQKQNTIKGRSKNALNAEIWEGSAKNYVSESDLSLTCSGTKIRCLKSVDLETKQTGWPTTGNPDNPDGSFNIDVEN